MKVAATILAAGASSRLGKPKQLLQINQQFALQSLHDDLCELCDSVIIITGCFHQAMQEKLAKLRLVYNENWQQGMGSSIAKAVSELEDDVTHLLICSCDQVLIPNVHYVNLLSKQQKYPNAIISSKYNNIHGVPALFPRKFFVDLLRLKSNQKGAKELIRKNKNTESVICPEAEFDLDNQGDFESLATKLKHKVNIAF